MDKQEKRLQKILGTDSERNRQSIQRYFEYLRKEIKPPCILSGIEDFLWEEKYVIGGWDKNEYEELKKDNPSYADAYELIDLLDPESEDDEIYANVKRVSDQKKFQIGLSWLECKSSKDINRQLIEDYSVWHVNY